MKGDGYCNECGSDQHPEALHILKSGKSICDACKAVKFLRLLEDSAA